jgi:hypothetical protein
VPWLVVGAAYAALAALLPPLGWTAMLATLPPLVVALVVSLRRPVRPAVPGPGRRRVLPWVAVVAAGIAWELLALFRSPRDDFPTISSIVSPLAGTQWWFRFVGYLLWFAAGWWLVRQSTSATR